MQLFTNTNKAAKTSSNLCPSYPTYILLVIRNDTLNEVGDKKEGEKKLRSNQKTKFLSKIFLGLITLRIVGAAATTKKKEKLR